MDLICSRCGRHFATEAPYTTTCAMCDRGLDYPVPELTLADRFLAKWEAEQEDLFSRHGWSLGEDWDWDDK